SAEGEHLLHKLAAPYACLKNPCRVTFLTTSLGYVIADQLREADDCSKNVIEFMGNTSGEGPEGLKFLRLAELGFELLSLPLCPFAFGNVGHDGIDGRLS